MIALADVGRATRFVNVVLGAWVIVAPWVVAGATPASRWNAVVAGVLVIALSLPRGPVGERYGTWDRFIR